MEQSESMDSLDKYMENVTRLDSEGRRHRSDIDFSNDDGAGVNQGILNEHKKNNLGIADAATNNPQILPPKPLLHHVQYQKTSNPARQDVIELLDDENDTASSTFNPSTSALHVNKRKRPISPIRTAGQASSQSRTQNMPQWMNLAPSNLNFQNNIISRSVASYPQPNGSLVSPFLEPIYIPMRSDHVPTWSMLLPRGFLAARRANEEQAARKKCYELSLLNTLEFTVTGASPDGILDATSVKGLRSQIRQISREYGKAVFERDSELEDGGKWRIPLGAYQNFFTYLRSLPNTLVYGIPASHLNIAMLAQQRKEKGYPSINKLIHIGVPEKIARTLAPFQRGGVEFVYERKGRALVADEMGKNSLNNGHVRFLFC